MERALDRRVEFDPRSRNFPIRTLMATLAPRSYTWGTTVILDQGSEGACVGFAWAQELASRPKVHGLVTNPLARQIYHAAQLHDQWDDTPPEEGTSVIAGAKEMVNRGYLGEYRWAFSIDDLKVAVSRFGPAVMGTWWWTGMFDADASGFVRRTGAREGGHAWLAVGFNVTARRFTCVNSWGRGWGRDGRFYVAEDDMAALLEDDGEGCIPTLRTLVPELRSY